MRAVWVSDFRTYAGSHDQEAEMMWSPFSPQGPLPHEANIQFNFPNLRCKNRSLGRDAHRQRNRLLFIKEAFMSRVLEALHSFLAHPCADHKAPARLKRLGSRKLYKGWVT